MGGENAYRQTVPGLGLGSPPRRRGKEASIFDDGQRLGITPAWAGKSQGHRADRGAEQDHPRMGGEKTMYFEDKYFCRGSPPRRRGKVGLDGGLSEAVGITPAQAGKSRRCCLPGSPRRDHPRVGGEKISTTSWPRCWKGSPPRGRGKGSGAGLQYGAAGITPA